MKNFSYIIKLIFVTAFFISCSNDSEIVDDRQSEVSAEELFNQISNEPLFADFLAAEQEHFNRVQDLDKILQIIQNKETLSDQEFLELSNALGYNDKNELISFYENQEERIKILNSKFKFTSQNLENLKNPIKEMVGVDRKDEHIKAVASNCDDRYDNCIVNAFAVATLEHIACGIADVTVVVRLICHSAVTALDMTATNECGYQKQDCEQNEKLSPN